MAEEETQTTMVERTPGQRFRALALAALLIGILLYFSCQTAATALADPHGPLWLVLPLWTLSALFAVAAIAWIVALVRRKLRTGAFLASPAEIAAKRLEYRSRMGAGKPFGPQAKYWVIPFVVLTVLGGGGVMALVAAVNLCDCPGSASWALGIFGVLLLVIPGIMVFKAARRKIVSGSFLPSQEELEKARSRCAAPRPLRTRILMAVCNLLPAILYTYSAIHHPQHGVWTPSSRWVLAAIWWFVAGIWGLQVFRPARTACAIEKPLSVVPGPSQDTTDAARSES
jgi:lysylphosphatidylglycerol synthetase-like protein (DUF2156 family)